MQHFEHHHVATLHCHELQPIAVLRLCHNSNITIIFTQDFLQSCQNLRILYQKLLHTIYVTLAQCLRFALRRSIPLQR